MTDLTNQTIASARNGLRQKKFSAKELVTAYLQKVEGAHSLNAFITQTPEHALQAADQTDSRLAKGEHLSMDGIPLGIKDLFCTKGVKTTSASHILNNFVPPYESTVTQNLWNAGAVMLGKTNMDQFAMGSANITSAYGNTINPWEIKGDPRKFVPGGSSGGSSAAVAADICVAATASDTGGSIRQPAAFCGLVGIKPTYGRCSRYGMVAFASSLDQAGPLTKTVQDAAIMLEVMSGYDPKDSTSVNLPVPNYEACLTGNIKGLRIGIPKEYQVEGLNQEIANLWHQGAEWLRGQGAEIVDISLPHTKYALPAYYIIAPAEASSNLARYDGVRYGLRVEGENLNDMYEKTREAGFGQEVKRRILMGTYVLSAGYFDAYYLKAQKVRRLILQDFINAFQKVDVILTPTTPTATFAFGEEPKDPIAMYLNDVLTVPANIAGLPGISVPVGLTSQGLPLGLQLLGPAFSEGSLLNSAFALESAANFSGQVEELRKKS